MNDDTLSQQELEALGRYNAERARGLQHAPAWDTYMAELQNIFNADQRAKFSNGPTHAPNSLWSWLTRRAS